MEQRVEELLREDIYRVWKRKDEHYLMPGGNGAASSYLLRESAGRCVDVCVFESL